MEPKNNNRLPAILLGIAAAALLTLAVAAVAAVAMFTPVFRTTSASAQGQANEPSVQVETQEPARTVPITVRGTGSINVKPDMIKMTVGVAIQDTTVGAAQVKVNEVTEAMTARLKAANISENDYRTSQYTVEPVLDYSGEKPGTSGPAKVVGFRVTNMFDITVRDAARGPELLDALTQAGANTIFNVNYALSNPEKFAQEAYDSAVRDAGERAGKLAGLANLELGKIVSISEPSAATPGFVGERAMGGGGGAIFPGQQSIQVDVAVTYEAHEK